MTKKTFRLLGKCTLLLLVGSLIGTLLLTLAFMVPVNQENAAASYQVLNDEGWYPLAPILSQSLDTYFHSHFPGVLDNGTDSIMLYTAMDNSEDNPFIRAMNMYCTYLNLNYSRYWHGYVAILRPLLFFFDFSEIRILNCLGQLLLVIFLVSYVARKKGWVFGLLMFTSYFLLMPIAMPLSLQFTWVFYIAAISCLILLKKQEYFETNLRYLYLFLIIGMVSSYFDLLTYPLFTWGFPITWLLVMSKPENTGTERLKKVIISGLSWIAGYSIMWVLKWIYASVILGRDILSDAINEVFVLSGAGSGKEQDLMGRIEAIYTNWKHYEYSIYYLVLFLWLAWIIIRSIRKGWKSTGNTYAYLLIGCSSIVWYFFLSYHTMTHHFFTYRIFNVSIMALLILLAECVYNDTTETVSPSHRQRFITIGTWGIIAILSFGATYFAREELIATNGAAAHTTHEIRNGGKVEASFTPTFSHITELTLGMESASENGTYEVSVWDEEQLLYIESIPIVNFQALSYHAINVDWHLKARKEYRLEIIAKDNEQPVYSVITVPEENPLNEYGELKINNEIISGQPITVLTYNARPMSRKTLFFLTLSWMGVLGAVYMTGYCFVNSLKKASGKESEII